MRARLLVTAIIVFVGMSGAGVVGQTRTADGVLALARGDYDRAVGILKPIAEDWRIQDPAAQFFMAGLYETGRGVAADPLRACALYMRAGSNFDNPFGREASRLVRDYVFRSPEFNDDCQALAFIGFDNGFEPVTFDLGPGHSVGWTLTGVTVTYKGKTKRLPMSLASPGSRFLPLEHTELATGSTRSVTRHFVEVFVWNPTGRSGPWQLQWRVFEVVRDEIIGIGIDIPNPLIVVNGDAPPPGSSFDVRQYAALRVDDEGNPEWAVLKGPHPMTQRIESDEERREIGEEATARDAALKAVNWKRRSDVNRQPAMAYVDAAGCGQFQMFGWSADRAEAVVVNAKVAALGLSTQPATFDLSRESTNLAVEAYVYAAPQRQFDFCSDARSVEGPDSIQVWYAIAGTVTIQLSPQGIRSRAPNLRRGTVTLTNMVLRSATGATVRISGPVKLTAIVGGFI